MTPYYDDGQAAFYHGDVCEVLPLIQRHDVVSHLFSHCDSLRRNPLVSSCHLITPSAGERGCFTSELPGHCLKFPKSQKDLALPSLNSHMWQQCSSGVGGLLISHSPRIQVPAVLRTGRFQSSAASECLMQQIDRLRSHLFAPDLFGKQWHSSITTNAHVVGGAFDADISVAVYDTGQVCKE